jgi:hypothetical protein
MPRAVPYTKGAHEVADGVWASCNPTAGGTAPTPG